MRCRWKGSRSREIVRAARDRCHRRRESAHAPHVARPSGRCAASGGRVDRVADRRTQSVDGDLGDVAHGDGDRDAARAAAGKARSGGASRRAGRSRPAERRRPSRRCSPRARARCPNAWQNGVGDDPPVVLCGEHAHYCVTRAVAQLGLGTRSALAVPSRDWKMDISALREMLDALAASRTRASWPWSRPPARPPRARSTICRAHWRAVRGARVSGCTWTARTVRPRSFPRRTGIACAGSQHARSLAWDAHKMMLMPLAAGMLLVRDESGSRPGILAARAVSVPRRAWRARLGSGHAQLPVLAQGRCASRCGSRFSATGMAGHRGALRSALRHRALAASQLIDARDDFVAMHAPETNILCFRWVGDGSLDDGALDAINLDLRMRYNRARARLDHHHRARGAPRAARDGDESAHHARASRGDAR